MGRSNDGAVALFALGFALFVCLANRQLFRAVAAPVDAHLRPRRWKLDRGERSAPD